jgi:hypothetical protein
MKRAYLFGAAALLILLIVVAYISFSREKNKDGDACVRPTPQVVGPNANLDPVTRALLETFNEDGDEEEVPLDLNKVRGAPIGGPVLVDPLLQSCMSPDQINYDAEMLKVFQRDGGSSSEYGERDVLQGWQTPVAVL